MGDGWVDYSRGRSWWPKDYAYGMRDFIVADPDGNHLAFGCRSEDTPPTAGLT